MTLSLLCVWGTKPIVATIISIKKMLASMLCYAFFLKNSNRISNKSKEAKVVIDNEISRRSFTKFFQVFGQLNIYSTV